MKDKKSNVRAITLTSATEQALKQLYEDGRFPSLANAVNVAIQSTRLIQKQLIKGFTDIVVFNPVTKQSKTVLMPLELFITESTGKKDEWTTLPDYPPIGQVVEVGFLDVGSNTPKLAVNTNRAFAGWNGDEWVDDYGNAYNAYIWRPLSELPLPDDLPPIPDMGEAVSDE